MIAGSNGAGKTTFATEYLPRMVGPIHFINAGVVAQGFSPFNPEQAASSAARVVLHETAQLLARRATFAIETTLSGRTYARMLERIRGQDYHVHLYFLWIPDTRLALRRIKSRVSLGGHNILSDVVRRRFHRTLWNLFHVYRPLLDHIFIVDNSGNVPSLVAERRDREVLVYNGPTLARILKAAAYDGEI